jgi:predicted nucleic acid-binding protein
LINAFDADVLIYAVISGHALGRRVAALFAQPSATVSSPVGIGSVLLLPELLAKPRREGRHDEVFGLSALLGRLDLSPVDEGTADLAVALSASYRLRPMDAVDLATAVNAGADTFITSNSRGFEPSVTEVDIRYPDDLSD